MTAFATYNFYVDCDNDGNFTGAYDEITSLVKAADWRMGRDYASQLTGRTVSASAEIVLDNYDDRFSSFNSSSPIYGKVLPGRKVKITMTVSAVTQTMFIGYLEVIEPIPGTSKQQSVAVLKAYGPLAYINQRKVNVPLQEAVYTGATVTTILDQIGWPVADRSIDTGQTRMNYWWTGGVSSTALSALRDIEDTEAGFLRETKDGKIAFEDREHRMKGAHLVSQATYTNSTSGTLRYSQIVQEDPMREIYNIFRAEVYNFQTDTLQVLWTLAESGESGPAIGPGETRVFYASVSGEISAAWPWTTPVPLVDYLAYDGPSLEANDYTAQVDVVVVKYDTLMKISITNNAAITLYMVRLMARGIPLLSSDTMIVIVEDATSKTKYGERTYPLPGKWIPSTS